MFKYALKLTVNLVLVHSDSYSLGTELIDTFALSKEHNLELLSVGVVIDELCQPLVNDVVLGRDVHCDPLLKLNDVVLQGFNLDLSILQLPEEFQRGLVSSVHFVFECKNVVRGSF